MDIFQNFIYIYHLDKFCLLPTVPDQISDTMSSRFESTSALSRSAPVQSYIQSGPRQITFQFDLHRDIMDDINTGVSNLKDNVVDFSDKDYVDVLLNYLQACALPKYTAYKTGTKAVDPPQVAIRMGNDIFIRGVVSGGITVNYQKPILDNGKYAKVNVTVPVTEVDPYDAPTVAQVGGFRGITSTFKSGIFKDESSSYNYGGDENVNDDNTTTEGRRTINKGGSTSYSARMTQRKNNPGWNLDKAREHDIHLHRIKDGSNRRPVGNDKSIEYGRDWSGLGGSHGNTAGRGGYYNKNTES